MSAADNSLEQPLVVAGQAGVADMVGVRYVGDDTLRFQIDHWGYPPVTSDPLKVFFFSSRRRHTILVSDWSSDVCSSDLAVSAQPVRSMGEAVASVQVLMDGHGAARQAGSPAHRFNLQTEILNADRVVAIHRALDRKSVV